MDTHISKLGIGSYDVTTIKTVPFLRELLWFFRSSSSGLFGGSATPIQLN